MAERAFLPLSPCLKRQTSLFHPYFHKLARDKQVPVAVICPIHCLHAARLERVCEIKFRPSAAAECETTHRHTASNPHAICRHLSGPK